MTPARIPTTPTVRARHADAADPQVRRRARRPAPGAVTAPARSAPAGLDFDRCYRAVASRDARFDGEFVLGVTSTGIYCRPSCPALTPRPGNVRFYLTAAAAQRNGFRACKRCVPDAVPGSPRWNSRADVVGRAMRLIADGVVDRAGVTGLADAVGYSERHLRRLLVAEVGAGPLDLARSQRAQTARVLVETTDLPFSRIAFAAGYASIRAFNDAMQQVFATPPQGLRARARARTGAGRPPSGAASATRLQLRLAVREPCDAAGAITFLGRRAVDGVEEVRDGVYRRSLRLPRGHGVVALRPRASVGTPEVGTGYVLCDLQLTDLRDLQAAVHRCRALLDLDADPAAVREHLGADAVIGAQVRARPGLRMVSSPDGEEAAARAVLGQQVALGAARRLGSRMVERHGVPLAVPDPSLTRVFPDAAALAGVDPATLPLPRRRARALVEMSAAIATEPGGLGPGSDADHVSAVLAAVPGIGPWTVALVRMRGLGDPDVYLDGDLGVRRGLVALGADPSAPPPARAWRPWRSYATHHLWAAAESAAAAPPTPTKGP